MAMSPARLRPEKDCARKAQQHRKNYRIALSPEGALHINKPANV
jgi:hypothetical protein